MSNCNSCGANEVIADFCAYCGSRRYVEPTPGSWIPYHNNAELQRLAAQMHGMQNAYSPFNAYGGAIQGALGQAGFGGQYVRGLLG